MDRIKNLIIQLTILVYLDFAFVPDDQVIPLLLSMDSDTLFNCGMASLRLYRLVCDPEVWRWLLKGIADFSKERVEHLVEFVINGSPDMGPEMTKGSVEMLPEVVKEVARRIQFCHRRAFPQPVLPQPFIQEVPEALRKRVRVNVTVEGGWGNLETFEVEGKHLEKLTRVAHDVGAMFTMVEVQDYNALQDNIDIFRMISSHMNRQTEKLAKLDFSMVALSDVDREAADIFFSLLKLTSEWSIPNFTFPANPDQDINDYLANIDNIDTTNGYIWVLVVIKWPGQLNSVAVRKLWEISDQMIIVAGMPPTILMGGRGVGDSQAEWENVEAALLQ